MRRPMMRRSRAVSIHAPAKGATGCRGLQLHDHAVSIHAPAKGATRSGRLSRCIDLVSIHAPAKGATRRRCSRCRGAKVSIHAPAKGATTRCRWSGRWMLRFDPRPREGGDAAASALPGSDAGFRSTPPRRGRPATRPPFRATTHVSIHAPAKGATPPSAAAATARPVSIHAPAKGATRVSEI